MPSSLFTYQRYNFELQFRNKFSDAFQEWFTDIARLMHPNGDIQSPRLTQGDGKIDVYVINEQLVYQCYGPQSWKPGEASSKIRTDFRGAYEYLNGHLKKWVFVHNHVTGQLDKNCLQALCDIKAECEQSNNSVTILAWGIEELWESVESMVPFASLQGKFGEANPISFDFTTIEGLLNSLEHSELSYDTIPVSQPFQDKLEFNNLARAYQSEIKAGRMGISEINKYFSLFSERDPEFPEKMAQHFRDKYARIKQQGLSPDIIYDKLRLEAGWQRDPNAKREMATRAILAYFFDSCDIFENPPQGTFK
jgi:hypothetical protein